MSCFNLFIIPSDGQKSKFEKIPTDSFIYFTKLGDKNNSYPCYLVRKVDYCFYNLTNQRRPKFDKYCFWWLKCEVFHSILTEFQWNFDRSWSQTRKSAHILYQRDKILKIAQTAVVLTLIKRLSFFL